MRILFMGSPDFAVVCLDALLSSSHTVLAVVSQPDKPKGRGKMLAPTAIKTFAEEKGLDIYTPDKIKDGELAEVLDKYKPDCIVVVAYGKILPDYVLSYPRYGCVNIHGSLLPKYRGASPMQFALLNGDKVTGITSMLMDSGLDTGDILLKTEVEISETDNFESLHDKMARAGALNLVETLDRLERGEITPIKQEGESSYASLIDKNMRRIDFTESTDGIYNKIRAFSPFPTAFSVLSGKIMKIYASEKIEKLGERFAENCGDVLSDDMLIVRTSDGAIRLTDIAPEGKRRMTDIEYMRGVKDKRNLKFQ